MPVGTIYTAKGLALAYQPLLLAVFTFKDSAASPTIRRFSTHGLRSADAGFVPSGITGFGHNSQEFTARIKNKEIVATQALSEQGIDITPTVTIDLLDPDKTLWADERLIGFKGAKLELFFIFWNVGQNDFSSDYRTIFVGRCDAAKVTEKLLSVRAVSRLNMNQAYLPGVRIQKRCPWIFTDTTGMSLAEATARHQDAADDPSSQYWLCGYSYHATGGNARGNPMPATTNRYQSCNYTVSNCIERLGDDTLVYSSGGFAPIEKDKAARRTGHFGAVQWDQPTKFKSRGYIDRQVLEGFNATNEAKYNDYVPMAYGTTWVDPIVLNVVGDANLTKMEVLLCLGEVQEIKKVVVNDIEVDEISNDASTQRAQIAAALWWKRWAQGTRQGTVNGDAIYDGTGDPYGNMSVIEINVPRRLSPSSAIPRVRALIKGPKVRVYTDLTTFSDTFSENPAWILMDLLTWLNWRYADFDIQTFLDAAVYYDVNIDFKNIFGITSQHARFKLGFAIRQRAVGADLIRKLRMACRSYIIPHSETGKLQLFPERTLADEQPSAITGSNYATAVKSKNSAGTQTNGFVAWKFTYDSILKNQNGESSLVIDPQPIQATPNRISISFTDEENSYQADSLTLIDAEDAGRAEQEVGGSVPVEGILNFDQGRRVLALYMAKNFRGNQRSVGTAGDSGGTYVFNFRTSFKCLHLRIGHIVMMDYAQLGLNAGLESPAATPVNGFLARVIAIKPSSNFEEVILTISYHNDDWYLNTYGQEDAPRHNNRHRDRLSRPALPWLPWLQQPMTNNPLWPVTEWGFGIKQDYAEDGADQLPIPRVHVVGKLPINGFAGAGLKPPAIKAQGTTAPTGGTIKAGKRYYALICSKDVDGELTPSSDPDQPCIIDVPAGADTATITVPVNEWGPGVTNYEIFAGPLSAKLSNQGSGAVTPPSTPASITLTALNEATWGLPDVEFDRMLIRAKRELHAGILGIEIAAVTSTTIQVSLFSDNQFTTNQFAPSGGVDYYITVLGLVGESGYLPIVDFKVASNTGDTFTLAASQPDPTAVDRGDGTTGLTAKDVVIVRMRPTVGSDGTGKYIEDANWLNAANPLLEPHQITAATNASPIVITTADNHGLLDGNKVYIQGVLGNTAANGVRYADRLTDTTFALYSNSGLSTPVAGNGAYTTGGIVQRQTEGMNTNEETGRELFIIRGKGVGTSAKIASNTSTRVYIEGEWEITPDGTSIFIFLDPNWIIEQISDTMDNTKTDKAVDMVVEVANYLGKQLFFQVFTLDGGGNESFRSLSPFREIYLFGDPGSGSAGLAALHITVDGILAIESDLGPRTRPDVDIKASGVRVEVKIAPVGAGLTVEIYTDTVLWMTLTIAAGTTSISATAAQLAAAALIKANQNVRVDITAVGSTTAGEDLSVTIYSV